MAYDFLKTVPAFSPFCEVLYALSAFKHNLQDGLLEVHVGLNSQFAALLYGAAHIGLSTALVTQGILSADINQ